MVRIARDKSETEEEIDALIYEIADWIEARTATTSNEFAKKSRKYLLNPIRKLRIIAFTVVGMIYVYYVLNKWLATKYHPEYKQNFGSVYKFLDTFSKDSIKALENMEKQNKKRV